MSEDFLTTQKRLSPLPSTAHQSFTPSPREEGLDSGLRRNDEFPIGQNTEEASEGIIRFTRGLFYGLGLSAVCWILIAVLVRIL